MLAKPMSKIKLEESCAAVPETKDTPVDDSGRVVKFNARLICVGFVINFLSDDTVDAIIRVSKVRKSMKSSNFT